MKKEVISRVLGEIELGYDQVAQKFSHTRKNFWSDLAFIGEDIKDGDRVLDYGCGNGRLWEIIGDKKIEYIGVDVSQKLIDLAQMKYPDKTAVFCKITSQASLAFPNDFFNRIISVAVFHHFPQEYACVMAKELARVTRPGGKIIVTVWNLWQKRGWKNIFNFSALIGKTFQTGEYAGFGLRDILVPFQDNQGNVFRRYHRVYTSKSLSAVFLSAGLEIERCYLSNGRNIVLVARKPFDKVKTS